MSDLTGFIAGWPKPARRQHPEENNETDREKSCGTVPAVTDGVASNPGKPIEVKPVDTGIVETGDVDNGTSRSIGNKPVARPESQPVQCPACHTEVAAGKISRSGDADPSTGVDRTIVEAITSTSAANMTVAAVRLAFLAGDAETGARWCRRSSLESALAE